jgi:Transposase DDE domain
MIPQTNEVTNNIGGFDDFCLWMYCIVEDTWRQVKHLFKRPGPPSRCSDSELMTMALVGECKGWDTELTLLSEWCHRRDLFPHIPCQSRFNRRRRHLMYAFNTVRQVVLRVLDAALDVAADRQCCIDSLPVPVVQFHLVPGACREWAMNGATFGRVASKKQLFFGYKMQLLVTLGGVILDFELVPANVGDLQAGYELLEEHANLDAVADKGYISKPVADALLEGNNVCLMTVPRSNQKRQLPPQVAECITRVRQIIETVNGQLTEQFNLQTNHAHTFVGLCTRLYTKLTAHTLCIYINRLLGKADFLHIKDLPFPI